MGDAPVGAILAAVVVVVCAAAGVGLLLLERRRSAATRRVPGGATPSPTATSTATPPAADPRALRREAAGAAELGRGGLVLLLFSRTGCARCRDTREVLALVTAERGDVSHREVDVDARPDLVAALEVRTTPTVVVVDAGGGELLRVAGVPRRRDLEAALAPHLP